MKLDAEILHLHLSPGHNFFGHHDQPAGDHRILEVPEVRCVAGQGLEGDRFFGFKDNYKGQITFFADEVHQALSRKNSGPRPRAVGLSPQRDSARRGFHHALRRRF